MIYRIIKIAAWSVAGWVFYRSLGTLREQVAEQPVPDSPRPDDGAEQQPELDSPRQDFKAEPEQATVPVQQNLRKVRGIGPGIEDLLTARGITTWAQLAATEVADLQAILDDAGSRYRGHDPSTWPAQAAELAKAN